MNPFRILVVEDETIVSMEIEERLSALGYQVVGCAARGDHALRLVEAHRPDLVLMDIHLQGAMDGITVAEEIRCRTRTPVVFLTAYSEDATLDRAKLAEPFGYILKPFEDRELKSAIEIALYKHRTEEEIRRLNRLYDLLSQVNQTVARTPSREDLLASVSRLVVERGEIDLAWIGWLDPASSAITPVAHFGVRSDILAVAHHYADERPEGQGIPGRAIREGRAAFCNACGVGECLYPAAGAPASFGFRSCGSFPFRCQGKVCGSLNLCVADAGFFRDREIELLKEVAIDISFALDKIESEARRERAEAALIESNERLNLALAASNTGVWELDMRTDAILWSPECYEILGVEGCGSTLESYASIIHPEDTPHIMAAVRRALEQRTPYAEELRINRPDGEVRWVSNVGQAEYDESGRPLRVVGTIQDVTERKRTEQEKESLELQLRQAQKLEAIGTLAGGIAHDFNNILSAIIGYSEMALDRAPDDSPLQHDLQQVLRAGMRAKELVKQILTFSRQTEREYKPVELARIVREVIRLLRATLPSTIEIRELVPAARQSAIMADPTEMHQIIVNLCTNAAYAMRESGGTLEVELTDLGSEEGELPLHSDLESRAYIGLRVSDTGCGMSEEVMRKIFDPFFTTKPRGEGTGMGLAVVHGIVKGMNGAIEVESTPGRGSTFFICFPTAPSETVETTEKREDAPAGKGRILFVDDEKALVDLGKKTLERLGYTVVAKTGSLGALEAFRSMPYWFDLLITDYTMPHMTGLQLAEEVKTIRPDMPIVICSGYNEAMNGKTASELGITAFLDKPYTIQAMGRAIREILPKG